METEKAFFKGKRSSPLISVFVRGCECELVFGIVKREMNLNATSKYNQEDKIF